MRNYYSVSQKILSLIKQSDSILINLHKNADPDSCASAQAMSRFIESLEKKSQVVSAFPIDDSLNFLSGFEKIKVIDFSDFEFDRFDLFIILDTGSFDRVTGDVKVNLPKINKIVIDHHRTNYFKEKYQLVDTNAASTTEIIYHLFGDWKYHFDKKEATILLSGIYADTVNFRYLNNPARSFKVISDLLKRGADFHQVTEQISDSLDFSVVKFIGYILKKIKSQKTKLGKQFVWSAISYGDFVQFGKLRGAKELAANMFFRSIKDSLFGLVLVEVEPGKIEISFRSKTDMDVSVLAKKFDGGGHKNAAGATVEGEFRKTVKKIISQIINGT